MVAPNSRVILPISGAGHARAQDRLGCGQMLLCLIDLHKQYCFSGTHVRLSALLCSTFCGKAVC